MKFVCCGRCYLARSIEFTFEPLKIEFIFYYLFFDCTKIKHVF
eukprot:UN24251